MKTCCRETIRNAPERTRASLEQLFVTVKDARRLPRGFDRLGYVIDDASNVSSCEAIGHECDGVFSQPRA